MRTVAVSDSHGKDIRQIYDSIIYTYEDKFDNIVFLGDYVDCREIHNELQIKRLLDLFDIQKNDERIHILIGNHDSHYLNYDPDDTYFNKFNKEEAKKVKDLLESNIMNLECVFWDGRFLYSHEGITKDFVRAIGLKKGFDSPIEICNQTNKMLTAKMYDELFKVQDGLQYRHCVNTDPNYNQFEKLKEDGCITGQVIGHFDKMGKQYIYSKGIFMIEDTRHCNYILFES